MLLALVIPSIGVGGRGLALGSIVVCERVGISVVKGGRGVGFRGRGWIEQVSSTPSALSGSLWGLSLVMWYVLRFDRCLTSSIVGASGQGDSRSSGSGRLVGHGGKSVLPKFALGNWGGNLFGRSRMLTTQ